VIPARADLLVIRRLHDGIYRSHGGGVGRVVSRHTSGPRGARNALAAHIQERRSACESYGNHGMGGGWIEAVEHGGEAGSGVCVRVDLIEDCGTVPVGATLAYWRQEVAASVRYWAAWEAERNAAEDRYRAANPAMEDWRGE